MKKQKEVATRHIIIQPSYKSAARIFEKELNNKTEKRETTKSLTKQRVIY